MNSEAFKSMAVVVIAVVLMAMLFGYQGKKVKQESIESRAYKLERKECYTWQDIEYVVHGDIQE